MTQHIPKGLLVQFEPEALQLTITIEEPEAFQETMTSLERFGVFIMVLQPQPTLNAVIAIHVAVPNTGRQAGVLGRVVSQMPTGTVMDLSISKPPELAALKAILEPSVPPSAPTETAVSSGPGSKPTPQANVEAPRPIAGPVSEAERAEVLKAIMDKGNVVVDQPIRHWGPMMDAVALLARKQDGLMVMYDGRIRTMVWLRAGGWVEDVQVWPRPAPSGLGPMLMREGWLTQEEQAQLQHEVDTETIDVAMALQRRPNFEAGWVSWAVAARLESLLMDAFRARRGRLQFISLDEPPYQVSSAPLFLPWLAYRATSRILGTHLAADVLQLAEQHKRHFPVRTDPAPFEPAALFQEGRRHQWTLLTGRFAETQELDERLFPFAPLYLTAPCLELYRTLDGEKRLWEVVRDASMAERLAEETLVLMARLGLVTFESRCPIPLDRTRAVRMEAVKARRAAVEEQNNPFEVLGIHWCEPQDVVIRSYRAVLGRALPERYPSALRGKLYHDLSAIRERLTWAHEQLATREQRAAVRRRLVGEEELDRTFSTLIQQIELLIWRWDLERANALCLQALELKPDHPAARAQLRQIALRKNVNTVAGSQAAGAQINLSRTPLGVHMGERETPSQRGLNDPEMPIVAYLMKRVAEQGLTPEGHPG